LASRPPAPPLVVEARRQPITATSFAPNRAILFQSSRGRGTSSATPLFKQRYLLRTGFQSSRGRGTSSASTNINSMKTIQCFNPLVVEARRQPTPMNMNMMIITQFQSSRGRGTSSAYNSRFEFICLPSVSILSWSRHVVSH